MAELRRAVRLNREHNRVQAIVDWRCDSVGVPWCISVVAEEADMGFRVVWNYIRSFEEYLQSER